jgi:hypothetical protein
MASIAGNRVVPMIVVGHVMIIRYLLRRGGVQSVAPVGAT